MNAARRKVEAEGRCRVCGDGPAWKLEAAHLWPRSRGADGFDEPDLIVPLCGRFGANCHRAFDAGELDLMAEAAFLSLDEELALVRAAKATAPRGSGIELARRRLVPSVYTVKPERAGRDLFDH